MFGFRSAVGRVHAKLTNSPVPKSEAEWSSFKNAALVTYSLYRREEAGSITTLRHLHRVIDISQREGLRTVAELERGGYLEIERNLHDELESRIALTTRTRDQLRSFFDADQS